ncbi:hypothetical protein VHEMI10750 [[Torrubiella] hemipterigena]|uniref:Uncharacterized protein n=1 Tax=[Torrubiella] hemipterigena TaxID=1531966 RepID=A0A0A1TSF3_9HYPO|nr:hypothetical protein VHEMI10750 [[Torrubiella] hemipterigena]
MLMQVRREDIELRLIETLKLGRKSGLPMCRLITLWRNDRWREVLTQWSQTALGGDIFNISLFVSIAGQRIDEYWTARMYDAMKTLQEMPGNLVDIIRLRDWDMLIADRSKFESLERIKEFFYPCSGSKERCVETGRRTGLLIKATAEQYWGMMDHICLAGVLQLPKIRALFKITKQEAAIISGVMEVVVSWVNHSAAKVTPRINNKP